MLSYIETDETDGFKININDYEIKSFSVPYKIKLKNLFIVKDNKLLYNKTFYKNGIILNASALGSIKMLEWLIKSGYEFKYDERAIYNASYGNHIHILEWFKNSGYELKYDYKCFDVASFYEHFEVLKWFKKSGYKLKYRNYALGRVKHHKILKFFAENICVKKVIKYVFIAGTLKFIKFKTKNNYIKGYNKN